MKTKLTEIKDPPLDPNRPMATRALTAMFEPPRRPTGVIISEPPAFYVHLLRDGGVIVISGLIARVVLHRDYTGANLDASLRFLRMTEEDRGRALAIVTSLLPKVTAEALGVQFTSED